MHELVMYMHIASPLNSAHFLSSSYDEEFHSTNEQMSTVKKAPLLSREIMLSGSEKHFVYDREVRMYEPWLESSLC